MTNKLKINCGRFQVGLGFIALIVGIVGFNSFVPIGKIILQDLKIDIFDILFGFLIIVYGIFLSALCLTVGFENITKGKKQTSEEKQDEK